MKKNLKLLLALLLFFPIATVLTSCSDDDDPVADITGDWEYDGGANAFMEFYFGNGVFDAEIGEEDRYGHDLEVYEIEGSYSIKGGNITLNVTSCYAEFFQEAEKEYFEGIGKGSVINGTINGNTINLVINGRSFPLVRTVDYDYDK